MHKTWFITGAGRGFGAEIAEAALRAGDSVVATGHDRHAVSDRLGPDDRRLLAVELDVDDERQSRAVVEAALARFGKIDVLVNNADAVGEAGTETGIETGVRGARTRLGTRLFGVFNVTRAVLPAMRAARSGRIVNVASNHATAGVVVASPRHASVVALEGFSESLADDLAPFGIQVMVVVPGAFASGLLPRS